MYDIQNLTREIDRHIEALGDGAIPAEWVTNRVMSQHDGIDGEDSDFYLCLTRIEVRDQVRRRLNKRFGTRAEDQGQRDAQLVLDGFERLQQRYLVEVGEEIIAIPVNKMTSAQRLAKVAELRRMGAGCYQHADELERYDYEVAGAA